MSETQEPVKKPSFFWGITEGGRALLELGSYLPYRMLNKLPKDGDGHPVLILPGFLASDFSTIPLRSFVDKLGYTVYGWGQGRNLANEEYVDLLLEKVDKIHEKHQSKISIIGWSLGGIYARQLGKEKPEKIRQIITLGSPFKGLTEPNNVRWLYDLLNKGEGLSHVTPELIADIPNPAPVPTTAIYSKQDGVVPWQFCMEEQENEIHQNIEVTGSHLGYAVNHQVLEIVADRLKYREENWVHFKSEKSLYQKFFFPC